MARIRPAVPADAPALLDLLLTLDSETKFMLLEPGERQSSPEGERERIEAILAMNNSTLLVAARDAGLVGFLAAHGGGTRRSRYTAQVVVGVRQAFAGQGIGARLFGALETWAHERGLHRLELSTMRHNERALHLYKKCGFVIEGTRREAMRVDGRFVDEVYLAKLL